MIENDYNLIRLDPDQLGSRDTLAHFFDDALDLPEWYGRNLDALADVLSEVAEETVFEVDAGELERFESMELSRKALRVIVDAVKENPHLHLYLE